LQTAFESKSQRLEPLAGTIGLLALVQTTRLTGGCDLRVDDTDVSVHLDKMIYICYNTF